MISELLPYLALGVFAGVFSGMFGVGGGAIIVPALILFTGMNIKEANGTSLGALMLPVGIFGCILYYKKKILCLRSAIAVSVGLVITIALGAFFANKLDMLWLKKFYGLFLLFIGWRFARPWELFQRKVVRQEIEKTIEIRREIDEEAVWSRPALWKLLLTGIVAGVFAGMFGIGGGAVIVPVLTYFLKFPTKVAVATSLGALLPPVGLPGVLVYYQNGNLDIALAGAVAIGLLCGTLFGAKVLVGLKSKHVKRLYGGFLLLLGLRFLF